MDIRQKRMAQNEEIAKRANVAITAEVWTDAPEAADARQRYVCECARLDCDETVSLTAKEYLQLQTSPRRFIVAPGHEEPEIEQAVERCDGYVVVQKS